MLPDEYDSIYHDLEPFWGMDPKELIQLQSKLEDKKDSYTIGKTEGGNIKVLKYAFQPGKYDQLIKGSVKILEVLGSIDQHLPAFRA